MTIETRTTIEPRDLAAIEFHCPKCHSVTSIPIDRFHIPPVRCSVCSSEESPAWLIHGSEEFRRLVDLGEILRKLGESDLRFGLTFRLAEPKPGGQTP